MSSGRENITRIQFTDYELAIVLTALGQIRISVGSIRNLDPETKHRFQILEKVMLRMSTASARIRKRNIRLEDNEGE